MAASSYKPQPSKNFDTSDDIFITTLLEAIDKDKFPYYSTYYEAYVTLFTERLENILRNNLDLCIKFIDKLQDNYHDDPDLLKALINNTDNVFGRIVASASTTQKILAPSGYGFFGLTPIRSETTIEINPLLEKILSWKEKKEKKELRIELDQAIKFADKLIQHAKTNMPLDNIDASSLLFIEMNHKIIISKILATDTTTGKCLTISELEKCLTYLRICQDRSTAIKASEKFTEIITKIRDKYKELKNHYGNGTEPTKRIIESLIHYFGNSDSPTAVLPYKKFILTPTNFKEFTQALQDKLDFWNNPLVLRKCTPAALDNVIYCIDPEVRGNLINMIKIRLERLNESNSQCYKVTIPNFRS